MAFDDVRVRKSGNHNRSGLPRALWMAMLRDINRGPNAFEQMLINREEAELKARVLAARAKSSLAPAAA